MTPREIARRALEFDSPERMSMNLPAGTDDYAYLPNQPPEGWEPPAPGVDEWGCTWVKTEVDNMGQVKGHPLTDLDLMAEHTWPDPEHPSRFRGMSEALAKPEVQERFVGAGFSNGLFERTWMCHGFQSTLEDLLLKPRQMHELIDRVTDIHIRACRAIYKYSSGRAEYYMTWDDLGAERGPFFLMKIWREFYYPAYRRLINATHELGMKLLLHSDGYMPEIVDDLCELGLDWINIQQPLIWGIDFLAQRYQGRITLNIYPDTQYLMPRGDPEEIRAHVRELVETLDAPEGGFVPGVYHPPIHAGTSEEATRIATEAFEELAYLHH